MAVLIVRNVSDEVHRALRARAAQHGRSVEAEVLAILESVVTPPGRVKLGSLLAEMGRQARLSDRELDLLQQAREKSPARSVRFE